MDLKLKQFAQDNVELVPDTMELLTDTELTQYYIQTWSLDYNDPGIFLTVVAFTLHQTGVLGGTPHILWPC